MSETKLKVGLQYCIIAASVVMSVTGVFLAARPAGPAQPLVVGKFQSLQRRNEALEAESRELRERVDELERLLGRRIEQGGTDSGLGARISVLERKVSAAIVETGMQAQHTPDQDINLAPIYAALAKAQAAGHSDGGPVVASMVAGLQAVVTDGSRTVAERVLSFRALGRLPDSLRGRSEPVVRSMVDLLESNPEGRRRQDVVTGLRGVTYDFAVDALIGVLKGDTSTAIRGEAAQSLASVTHLDSVRLALEASARDDPEEDVREEARIALARTRPSR